MTSSQKNTSTDFTKFTSGVLGNYKSCSVTEIFARNKKTSDIKLIYKLVNFYVEEINFKENTINQGTIINTKVIPDYNFGITEYSNSIQEAEQLFNDILRENKWNNLLGKWDLCESKFVQVDLNDDIILYRMLRNNFFNGSYIQDFLDFNKEWFQLLLYDQKALNELSSQLYKFRPIDITAAPDRLGNVIFQFTASRANFDICAYKDGTVAVNMEPFISDLVATIGTTTTTEYGVIVHGTSETDFINSLNILTHTIDNTAITKKFNNINSKKIVELSVNLPKTANGLMLSSKLRILIK